MDRPDEDSLQKGPQPSVGRQKTNERWLNAEKNYCQEPFDRKDWKGGKSFVFPIKAERNDFLCHRFLYFTCWQNDSFHCSSSSSASSSFVLGCAKKADVSLHLMRRNKDGWTFTGCVLKSEEEREEEQEIIIHFLWSSTWGDARYRRSQPDQLICCAPVAWFRFTNWRVRHSALPSYQSTAGAAHVD